jgi:K+-transporting ATPase ATPase C chain
LLNGAFTNACPHRRRADYRASKQRIGRVKASCENFRKDNPDYQGPIPADLLTASASGLDRHISPDSALAQVARVAKARGVGAEQMRQRVLQNAEQPDVGVLGDRRVNVLKLNLGLDRTLSRTK